MMNILEMKHIGKKFSGAYANEKIDLSVVKGEIHALLGENGAGKTTLMNILFGIYSADEGEIFWKGKQVHFHSPKDAIAEGIGMVHQHFSLVNKMTVLDNVILGLEKQGFFLDRKSAKKSLEDLAERYGLQVDPDARISDLSVGQQQRVEILKALYRNVELLILDEPTGVLTPKETEKFFSVLRKLKAEGYAVIIITHRMSEIMSISDRVTILRDGKKIKDLVTKDTNPTELSNYMIGRQLDYNFEVKETEKKEIALQLKDITVKKGHKKPVLDQINLEVYKGEILGIAGVDGNGQKELAEVIAGIRKISKGEICYMGEEIASWKIKERFEKGISYISDDRHRDGLVLDMNVEENLILRQYDKKPFLKNGLFQKKAIKENAEKAIEKYHIKTSGNQEGETPVKFMSGGNQQKVILAREITEHSKLIIANQPTRGLDIGATQFVRQVWMDQRNEGKSVILISADLEEIMQLSDRVAVMFGGKIVGVQKKEEIEMEQLGLLMGGITKEEMK